MATGLNIRLGEDVSGEAMSLREELGTVLNYKIMGEIKQRIKGQ